MGEEESSAQLSTPEVVQSANAVTKNEVAAIKLVVSNICFAAESLMPLLRISESYRSTRRASSSVRLRVLGDSILPGFPGIG